MLLIPVLARAIVLAVLFVAAPAGWAAQPARCPEAAQIRKRLELPGAAWQVACKPDAGGRVLLAALLPAGAAEGAPRLVAAVADPGGALRRADLAVTAADDKRVREVGATADEWKVKVVRAGLSGEQMMRVELTARGGGNLLGSYEILALLRMGKEVLVPLWIGMGSWEEDRFQICLVKARATFKLERTGEGPPALERITRIQRRKGPAPVDDEPSKQVEKECAGPLTERQVFPLAAPL
jgi:hypothetical protein